jgi:hypothetical protein
MTEIRTKFLFRLALEVGAHHVVGPTPVGDRLVAPISGGIFDGPRLSGTVLPGGTDWITVDAGGTCLRIDVRVPLRTLDGALLVMAYRGVRSGPSEVLERVARGEVVDPASYYYRVAGSFETASPELAWLNTVVAVAVGSRSPTGPAYEVFELL